MNRQPYDKFIRYICFWKRQKFHFIREDKTRNSFFSYWKRTFLIRIIKFRKQKFCSGKTDSGIQNYIKMIFFSDNEFYNCLERIPFIISNPDYISVHKKDNSISFIKDFSAHVSVAIRISSSGSLSYRTMYPITDAQLNNYISKGSSWKWSEPQNTWH